MDERSEARRARRDAERKKRRIRRNRIIALVLFLAIIAGAAFTVLRIQRQKAAERAAEEAARLAAEAEERRLDEAADERSRNKPLILPRKTISLKITCIGDIMAHGPQLTAAQQSDGSYEFTEPFTYVKPWLSDADLTLANLECTTPGSNYRGYPSFRTPDSIVDAMVDAGIDVAITSNNHMYDSGYSGMIRTMEVCKEKGLTVSGTRAEGEERWQIVEVKGLKVGILAYTYETPRQNGRRSLNGNPISDAAVFAANTYSQDGSHIDADLKSMSEEIKACREAGAELMIAYVHWGEEYQKKGNKTQYKVAQALAEAGADVIFASHPHVVQEISYIEVAGAAGPAEAPSTDAAVSASPSAVTEPAASAVRRVPVFVSMGNFISNQRRETLASVYGTETSIRTEQGMIANLEITYDRTTGTVSYDDVSYVGTWVEKYRKNGKDQYYVIPLVDGFEENPDLKAAGHVSRAADAQKALSTLTGEEFIHTDAYERRRLYGPYR
jgi:poly-gamma-glutamate synthesis protein (capsule biosynthesis protein)